MPVVGTGNVWEWCGDWYGEAYYGVNPRVDPEGPRIGYIRVRRGGSWNDRPQLARVAYRYGYAPDGRDSSLGLRLARTAQ